MAGPDAANTSGGGGAAPPPATRARRFLDREELGGARRAVAVLAIVLAGIGLVMWALSFVPGAPTAAMWQALVMPALVLLFVPFGLMMINEAANRPDGPARRSPLPGGLRGRRGAVAAVVFGAVWLSGAALFIAGDLGGQPMASNGVYTSNDHGVVTEITEAEWRDANAKTSRLFAGGVLLFSTIAALVLTRDPDEEDPGEQDAKRRLGEPHTHPSVLLADLRGHRRVQTEVPGTADEVTVRLRAWLPLRASATATGSTRLVGEADAGPLGWPLPTSYPLLVDGELAAAGASTSVDLSLRPATRSAELGPLGALWALVIVGLGTATIGRHLPFPMSLVFVAMVAVVLFGAYRTATAPRRAARAVEERIVETLLGGTRPSPLEPG